MENREPNKFEKDLAEVIGGVQIGAARAIAALAEALAKQPGIDRQKLLDDWFEIIPNPDQAGQIDAALYRHIDQLLETNHAIPPRSQEQQAAVE
ncbi:hypothetical protein [Xanthomonas campestris]|uniref:hypothetical protein n=1 Tax=Xanthomonas campestris TaxID=339 RepID=UPI002B228158|nr:hypothetical protein [Xanthomonas campestris]MEA9657824.1 hypothetical protein [Xanthomonas campestris pv. raphani]